MIPSILNILYRIVTRLFFYMLIFKKWDHVSAIRTYGMINKCQFSVLSLYYVCTCNLIIHNKRLNVKGSICQFNRESYTQILILLKSSLVHVRLRSDAIDT